LCSFHSHKQKLAIKVIIRVEDFSEKTLDSDDHFDRPFLFMGVKGTQTR